MLIVGAGMLSMDILVPRLLVWYRESTTIS